MKRARMVRIPGQHALQDGRDLRLGLAAHERMLMALVAAVVEERRAAGHRAHQGEGAWKVAASRSSGYEAASLPIASA